jgi:hypothetical protein
MKAGDCPTEADVFWTTSKIIFKVKLLASNMWMLFSIVETFLLADQLMQVPTC